MTGYLMAGDSEAKKECPLAAATKLASGGAEGGCCSKTGTLAAYPSYQRANELLKSWAEVPAKLAGMSESDRSELTAAVEKMHSTHPAAPSFQPTMALLTEGIETLSAIDAAAAKLCAEQCSAQAKTASAEGATAQAPACPVAAAALTSAKKKMEQSTALVAKANEVMLVAFKPASGATCSDKSACAGEKAALASAEVKTGGCPSAQTASLASATEKTEGTCTKATAALASAEGKTEGGCAEAKTAALASAEGGSEGGCAGAKTAALASAEEKADGCCAKPAAAMASATEEKPCCVKSLSARAESVIARSGTVLARWEGAGIGLAAMDSGERANVEKATQVVMTRCPMGSRIPESLDTVAALLRDAATLSAQAKAEVMKHEELTKMLSPEMKQLCEARSMTLAALINVMEKSNGMMRPARQVASAD